MRWRRSVIRYKIALWAWKEQLIDAQKKPFKTFLGFLDFELLVITRTTEAADTPMSYRKNFQNVWRASECWFNADVMLNDVKAHNISTLITLNSGTCLAFEEKLFFLYLNSTCSSDGKRDYETFGRKYDSANSIESSSTRLCKSTG